MKKTEKTAETEKTAKTAKLEEAGTPAALEADTGVEPPAEPNPRAAAKRKKTETKTEAENGSGTVAEAAQKSVPLSVIKTPDAEVIESPLKRMKAEFHQRSQVIKEQMRNIQNSFITIGFQLHWIRENKMYRVLDYRNIYEYAEKEYGIKKTSCNNFISIIENYAQRDENGNVIESIADCYRNYSASQLVAMLGMDEETKQQVTPDMSVRAINRMRKDGDKTDPSTVTGTDAGNLQKTDTAAESTAGNVAVKGSAEAAGRKPDDKQDVETKVSAHVEKVKTADVNQPAAPETAKSGDNTQKAAIQDDEPPEDTEEKSDRTLAEIDSYLDYRSMLDELDLMIKHAFAASASARVRIICVQG